MAKLGPIDFIIVLPININVTNDEQNKFEVQFSKNKAKIANFRIVWWQELGSISFGLGFVFGLHFCTGPHIGNILCMDPKQPLSCRYVSRPSAPNYISKSVFQKYCLPYTLPPPIMDPLEKKWTFCAQDFMEVFGI